MLKTTMHPISCACLGGGEFYNPDMDTFTKCEQVQDKTLDEKLEKDIEEIDVKL